MAENLNIDKSLADDKLYEILLPQMENLIYEGDLILSNLSNFVSVLFEAFDKISWVGFYFLKDDILHLGPFQGKLACTQIKLGNGVCGTAAKSKETIIVEDVDKFPGHIACDSGSKSEIVLPIIYNNKLIGVLDIDSYRYSAFNETDKFYLEKLLSKLTEKLNFDNFLIS